MDGEFAMTEEVMILVIMFLFFLVSQLPLAIVSAGIAASFIVEASEDRLTKQPKQNGES